MYHLCSPKFGKVPVPGADNQQLLLPPGVSARDAKADPTASVGHSTVTDRTTTSPQRPGATGR